MKVACTRLSVERSKKRDPLVARTRFSEIVPTDREPRTRDYEIKPSNIRIKHNVPAHYVCFNGVVYSIKLKS